MKLTTVLFDMDGTLLPINQDEFVKAYFKSMSHAIEPLGYEPETLKKTIIKSTFAMVNGDGSCVNEKIFWDYFCSVYGEKSINDKPVFDRYYIERFDELKVFAAPSEEACELVNLLKSMGVRLVLATNPLFPSVAIQKRLCWAGLNYRDFELYTTYENSCHCKPNPKYYEEILEKLNLNPNECLMVGNDVDDDMIASKAGIDVFLLTDCLINRQDRDISIYPQGNFKDLKQYILNRTDRV